MQYLQYNPVDDQIKRNSNKLLKLQIEYQTMQNQILRTLLDKGIPINLPIVKYNKIVMNNEKIIIPPPPQGMYI